MTIWLTRLIFWTLVVYGIYLLWKKTGGDKKNLIGRLVLILTTFFLLLAFLSPDSPVGAAIFNAFSFFFRPLGFSIILLIWAISLTTENGLKKPAPQLIFTALLVFIISSTPIMAFWLARGVERTAIEDVNLQVCCSPGVGAIVLLGQGTTKAKVPEQVSVQLTDRSDRIPHAAEIYKEGLASAVIVSAGPRPDIEGQIVEADEVKKLLVYLGVNREDIILDRSSVNLRQSALATNKIIESYGLERTVFLVTSALQMPRAKLAFANFGINVINAPTDFNTFESDDTFRQRITGRDFFPNAEALLLTTRVLEEYWGLFYYFVRGWSGANM
ncbi:MAG: YdcF family protein [Cyanobacteriota bacterium]|nr:YdcF family protein [Cyanobacteriota bacterium]